MSRDREAHHVRLDGAARGLYTTDRVSLAQEGSDLALLYDVHAGSRGRARIAPGHRVVAYGAAARLQKSTEDGVAAIVEVDQGDERLDGVPVESQGVHRQQAHAIGAARKQVALRFGVEKVQRAALADHCIEVQPPLEPFPQLERVVVETHVLRTEVVGADDRRVAPDVAEADRPFVDDGHVADAELGGEVVSRREALAPATDDHHPVTRARARLVPRARPAAMA